MTSSNDKILLTIIIILIILIVIMVANNRHHFNSFSSFNDFRNSFSDNYNDNHNHDDHHKNQCKYNNVGDNIYYENDNYPRRRFETQEEFGSHHNVRINHNEQSETYSPKSFEAKNANFSNDSINDDISTVDGTNMSPEQRMKMTKTNMIPTFERDNYDEDSEFEYTRRSVQATIRDANGNLKYSTLPENFSSIKQWSGMIGGVFDQERCGVCWAMSVSNMTTDRFRIQSGGKELADGNYLSPYYLAACMKCGKDNVCPKVCEGNYLDDVLQYLVDHGTTSQFDIERIAGKVDREKIPGNEGIPYEESFICHDPVANNLRLYKGVRKYRVNLFPPSKLTLDPKNKQNLAENEKAIMEEIMMNGPVCCIIKVFIPRDSRNFYNHKSGVYGYGWKDEPKEMDGYHAINITGWGVSEETNPVTKQKEQVKYWIIRNSWGNSWASNGFARVLRGSNMGYIESDIWALQPMIELK